MDPTTREASPPPPPPLTEPRPAAPNPPAALSLVRWALVLHTGLWVLVTLAHAVSLAAGTASASAAGSWLRLASSVGMAVALAAVAYRIGAARPVAWGLAVLLQVVAAAGYAELTLTLLADGGQTLAPDLLTLVGGAVLVLASLAGVVLTASPAMRGWCGPSSR